MVPSKLGPARRNHHIIEQLARYYDVSVLGVGVDGDAKTFLSSFRAPVAELRLVSAQVPRGLKFFRKIVRTALGQCDYLPARAPALRRACEDMAAGRRFDAVMLSLLLLRRLPLPNGVPVVADTHNVESDVYGRMATAADGRLRRLYAARQCRLTRDEERRCGARVDLLLATSDRDRQLFESELQIPGVEVIPNGIDLEEFQPVARVQDQPLILFSGLMSYYPNPQGIRWFLDRVFPAIVRHCPEVRLVIAGAAPPAWLTARRDARVEVTGRVPDMRPYLAAASVVIAPLLIGGGTRVKILEAQAMCKPVVSTSLGAEGLDERHGDTVLLADEPGAFARHVLTVLRNADVATRIAENGRRHVTEHFDWQVIGDKLAHTLAARIGLSRRG